jgi:hypothetical protein
MGAQEGFDALAQVGFVSTNFVPVTRAFFGRVQRQGGREHDARFMFGPAHHLLRRFWVIVCTKMSAHCLKELGAGIGSKSVGLPAAEAHDLCGFLVA